MELQHLEPRKKSVDLSVHAVQSPEVSQTRSQSDVAISSKRDSRTCETPDKRDQSQNTLTSARRRNEKLLSRLQFLTLCWTLFLLGWNDSSTGPLIPRIREVYGVRNLLHRRSMDQ
jgi:fucose permease